MHWAKGKTKETDERLGRISERMKRNNPAKRPEVREKMRRNHADMKGEKNPFYGRHHTKEVRDYLSKINQGKKSPRYGKRHRSETIEKMRVKATGRKLSSRTKEKLRIAHLGKPAPKGAGTGKYCKYSTPHQGLKTLRSTWELTYAQYLDLLGEDWYYELKRFNLGDTTYTPDFYIVSRNEWHEIKGYMRPNGQKKISLFKMFFPRETLVIIGKEEYYIIEKVVNEFMVPTHRVTG